MSSTLTPLLPKKKEDPNIVENVWSRHGIATEPSAPQPVEPTYTITVLERIEQNTREAYIASLLQRIDQNTRMLRDILNSIQQKTNHSLNYFLDTSKTSEQTIDIIKDIGMPMHNMSVIDTGGGFSFKINDEGASITAFKTQTAENEIINKLYWTGAGTTGTAHIRFNMWM